MPTNPSTFNLMQAIYPSPMKLEGRVNIRDYPASIKDLPKEPQQITIGDVHGNFMFLFYILIRRGAIDIKGTEQEKLDIYNSLWRYYDDLSPESQYPYHENVEHFKVRNQLVFEALAHLTFNKKIKLCLIGDIFTDRGNNDYPTLLLLASLKKAGVSVDILISNHDAELISNIETEQPFDELVGMGKGDNPDWTTNNSAVQLQNYIDAEIITREEVKNLAYEVYHDSLKLISYSFNPGKNEMSLYSHAPIGINTIWRLTCVLRIPFNHKTPVELAKTIDKINMEFNKQFIQASEVHTVFDLPQSANPDMAEIIHEIIWNRDYDKLQGQRAIQLENSSYFIRYVHGHDSDEKGHEPENVVCLDGALGKGRIPTLAELEDLQKQLDIKITEKEGAFEMMEQLTTVILTEEEQEKIDNLEEQLKNKKSIVERWEQNLNRINDQGDKKALQRKIDEMYEEVDLLEEKIENFYELSEHDQNLIQDQEDEIEALNEEISLLQNEIAIKTNVLIGILPTLVEPCHPLPGNNIVVEQSNDEMSSKEAEVVPLSKVG